MSQLSREEIALLNCFNYLNIGDWKDSKLGTVVNDILDDPNRFERFTADKPAGIGPENWKSILKRIQGNEKLCSLTIAKQSQEMGYNPQGLNAVCFQNHESQEATFVFRGTGRGEWLDNGVAFSEQDSPQQLEALEYFECAVKELGLKEKGYVIDVTGHSKGGNKAQFVTINSDSIRECVSFDGQGFSKEALAQYKDKIEQNSHKITSIAADNDYVHCLGYEIAVKRELFKTKYSKLIETAYHHCPDAILNEKGELTEKVKNEPWQNIMINRYTTHLMELDKDMKKEIFTSFMGLAQMYLGKEVALGKKIPCRAEAKRAFSEASTEFKRWFGQDRNRFTFNQKLVLAACGAPILKLAQFPYAFKHISFAKMEENVLGSLSKDIHKEFKQSKDGNRLQKLLETFKSELKVLHKRLTEIISNRREKKISTADDKGSSAIGQKKKLREIMDEKKLTAHQKHHSSSEINHDRPDKDISQKVTKGIEHEL